MTTHCTRIAHEVPTIAKLPSGSRRAQVRRKGRCVSDTFLRRDDALRWSRLAELSVDRNETPVSSRIGRLTKFGELGRLHIEDMTAVGKPPRRSKAATLDMLERELETIKITTLDRERLIQFGRARSEAGAGPVTLGTDIGTIGIGSVACRRCSWIADLDGAGGADPHRVEAAWFGRQPVVGVSVGARCFRFTCLQGAYIM